jgi:hypothetical protein
MDATPTYYGRPALKPSLYGWMVALYVFVGGMAGAVQILVTVVDLLGTPESGGVVLAGRVLALAGAIFGGILLIIELHTRQRFFNMLRIFRPTSPMSIGSYVLMSFGFWSLASLIVELLGLRVLTLIFACLAAVAGWFMTIYTASLLAATSTPLWAAAPRSLAVRFAGSAFASGAAVLCIIAVALGTPLARAFGNFAIIALAVEFVASLAAHRIYHRRGVSGPLRDTPWGPVHLAGVQICGDLLPIALYLADDVTSPNPGALAVIASLCVLAGSFLMRGVLFLAGNESARRPLDYFAFAARTETTHGR